MLKGPPKALPVQSILVWLRGLRPSADTRGHSSLEVWGDVRYRVFAGCDSKGADSDLGGYITYGGFKTLYSYEQSKP